VRVAIIGAGILGAAVGRELTLGHPGVEVTIYDKEPRPAVHQTGHNSGVVHAGLYYPPGSLKATLCQRGRPMLREFCQDKGLPYDEVGKVVVARDEAARARLENLRERAIANGVPGIRSLSRQELAEIEPLAVGVAAMHSPHTAITDYAAVTAAMLDDVAAAGGSVRLGCAVRRIAYQGSGARIVTDTDDQAFDRVISCGGLQSDRLVRAAGVVPAASIVPFRGKYYHLRSPGQVPLRGLIYPVPDPKYPFLGVHVTRHTDGAISVGPNAVLALDRERYDGFGVRGRDVASIAGWRGSYPMAWRHWVTGVREMALASSKRLFLSEVAKIFSGIADPAEAVPAEPGIRAQAVDRNGALLDDFAVQQVGSVVFVLNAPSPAATSSLAIAEHLLARYADWTSG
jgi:L-2-hydroxyglutarate oxidase LhgO